MEILESPKPKIEDLYKNKLFFKTLSRKKAMNIKMNSRIHKETKMCKNVQKNLPKKQWHFTV